MSVNTTAITEAMNAIWIIIGNIGDNMDKLIMLVLIGVVIGILYIVKKFLNKTLNKSVGKGDD